MLTRRGDAGCLGAALAPLALIKDGPLPLGSMPLGRSFADAIRGHLGCRV